MRSKRMVFSAAAGLMVVVQVATWWLSARHTVDGYAWTSLVRNYLTEIPESSTAACIAVAPSLYESTPVRERNAIGRLLRQHGVELRVAPPTPHVETAGYFERECIELFAETYPHVSNTINTPFVSRSVISYYAYDWNGDGVLLLQLGSRWFSVASWSLWI